MACIRYIVVMVTTLRVFDGTWVGGRWRVIRGMKGLSPPPTLEEGEGRTIDSRIIRCVELGRRKDGCGQQGIE